MSLNMLGSEAARMEMARVLDVRLANIEGVNVEEDEGGFYKLSISGNENGQSRKAMERVSTALSESIIEDMQIPILARLVNMRHGDLPQTTQARLLFESRKGLVTFLNTKKEKWLHELKKRLCTQLEESGEIIPEGFLLFRMKDILAEWEMAVERAYEELLIEKEYNEFINLLRYFVELQKPKAREVHVLLDGVGGYLILDENMKMMNCEDFLIGEDAVKSEDALISSLINIAPCFITIHASREKMPKVMDTINKVFTGRVKYEPDVK